MSQSVSNLTPLDSDHDKVDNIPKESSEKGRCACGKCGLYRWYPPMILISTVMAAIFCWMYIKKPVFLSTPSDKKSFETQPAIQERRPVDMETELSPPTAESVGRIDPAIAVLPGDPVSESLSSLSSAGAHGTELKPLVIKREGPALFRPLDADLAPSTEQAVAEQSEDPPVEPTSQIEDIAEQNQEERGNPGDEPEVVNLVSSGEGAGPVDSDDYQVHASFMAEFSGVESRIQKGVRKP